MQLPHMNPFPGPNSVVVMDNASIHRTPAVLSFLWRHQIHVVFTPAYTPERNPIEELFAQLKAIIKRHGAAWYRAGVDNAGMVWLAMSSINSDDCIAYIKHAGY